MKLSVSHIRIGTKQDVDNPDSDRNYLAAFIPAAVPSLVMSLKLQESFYMYFLWIPILQDIASVIIIFPLLSQTNREDKIRKLVYSSILCGTQGILASITMLFFGDCLSNIIDIMLDFTAVGFISDLDVYFICHPHSLKLTVGLAVYLVYLTIQIFLVIVFQILKIHQWYDITFGLTKNGNHNDIRDIP